MMIGSILRHKPGGFFGVSPQTSIAEVVSLLAEKNIGAVLVLVEGKLVGILSERDIVRKLSTRGADVLKASVLDLMTPNPTTATPETSVEQALEVMTERHFRHLPVLENGALVGVVSIGDIVKARIDQSQHEVETLRTYVGGRV